MRRSDEPDVNLMSAVAAEPLKFLLLQNAQQFCLKFERDVAHFIQKQRRLGSICGEARSTAVMLTFAFRWTRRAEYFGAA